MDYDASAARPRFENVWRELQPKLRRSLQARGAPPDLVDDLLQETSIRLLNAWDHLDHSAPVLPLARKAAFNLMIDSFRKRTAVPVQEIPEPESSYDLEDHVLARTRLSMAKAALDNLNPPDRAALLAEVGFGEHANSSARKMARLRARRRLKAALDQVAAAFGAVLVPIKRVLFLASDARGAEVMTPAVVNVAALITTVALSISPGISTPLRSKPRRIALETSVQASRPYAHVTHKDRHLVHEDALAEPVSASRSSDDGESQATSQASHPGSEGEDEFSASAGSGKADPTVDQGDGSAGTCPEGSSSQGDPSIPILPDDDGSQSGNEPDPCS